jgi:hypothetical protein
MWATLDDVRAITGSGAEAVELAVAQSVIEVFANRTPDATESFGARNLHWLKAAVCWQTVWQRDQPGFNAQQMVRSFSQDGENATYTAEWNLTLAPMAARALKNLSWKGTRSINTPNARVPLGRVLEYNFINERSDDYSEWSE